MEVVMAAHVCLKYLGCIGKDGIGTITDEAGNINSAIFRVGLGQSWNEWCVVSVVVVFQLFSK
jgi:hypothetical protein